MISIILGGSPASREKMISGLSKFTAKIDSGVDEALLIYAKKVVESSKSIMVMGSKGPSFRLANDNITVIMPFNRDVRLRLAAFIELALDAYLDIEVIALDEIPEDLETEWPLHWPKIKREEI